MAPEEGEVLVPGAAAVLVFVAVVEKVEEGGVVVELGEVVFGGEAWGWFRHGS